MLSSFHLAFDQSPHMATNLKPNTAVIPQSCVGTLKYNVPLIFLRMFLPRGFPKEQLPISTTVFFQFHHLRHPHHRHHHQHHHHQMHHQLHFLQRLNYIIICASVNYIIYITYIMFL